MSMSDATRNLADAESVARKAVKWANERARRWNTKSLLGKKLWSGEGSIYTGEGGYGPVLSSPGRKHWIRAYWFFQSAVSWYLTNQTNINIVCSFQIPTPV